MVFVENIEDLKGIYVLEPVENSFWAREIQLKKNLEDFFKQIEKGRYKYLSEKHGLSVEDLKNIENKTIMGKIKSKLVEEYIRNDIYEFALIIDEGVETGMVHSFPCDMDMDYIEGCIVDSLFCMENVKIADSGFSFKNYTIMKDDEIMEDIRCIVVRDKNNLVYTLDKNLRIKLVENEIFLKIEDSIEDYNSVFRIMFKLGIFFGFSTNGLVLYKGVENEGYKIQIEDCENLIEIADIDSLVEMICNYCFKNNKYRYKKDNEQKIEGLELNFSGEAQLTRLINLLYKDFEIEVKNNGGRRNCRIDFIGNKEVLSFGFENEIKKLNPEVMGFILDNLE